jgi:hypothetical protein
MPDQVPTLIAVSIRIEFAYFDFRVVIAPILEYAIDKYSEEGLMFRLDDDRIGVDSICSVLLIGQNMMCPDITLMHFAPKQFENRFLFHWNDREVSPYILSVPCVIEDAAHRGILFPPGVRDRKIDRFIYAGV